MRGGEKTSSLASASLQTIVWSADVERAGRFYREVLGLEFTGLAHGAHVFDVGGSTLRVSPVPSTVPSPHTVAGFAVADAKAVIGALAAKGVAFERFEKFAHAEDGSWTAPDGSVVAWFRDPDGNLLSVVQYARS